MVTSVFTLSDGEREGKLVGKLTHDFAASHDGRNIIGFVAVIRTEIVGAIFFSRLFFTPEIDAMILGPVAVHTDHQNAGVGQGLIGFGLESIHKRGVELAVTYGDPAYYTRFGFRKMNESVVIPPYPLSQPTGWIGMLMNGDNVESIVGKCDCVEALKSPEYW
jgi:predicted N-acetyltransferase YhbS